MIYLTNFKDSIRTLVFTTRRFGFNAHSLKLSKNWIFNSISLPKSDEVHLKATLEWIQLAHSITNGKGVIDVFYLNEGWGEPYPETSGYIISTFLAYGKIFNKPQFVNEAIIIGDWEIDIQADNGGIYSSPSRDITRVFNTGQVILGWCDLFEVTGNKKYLSAAIKSGEYLLQIQDVDGSWNIDTHCGARTYHSRVAWGLLRLSILSNDARFKTSAQNNIKWIMSNIDHDGWFENCGFNEDIPIMHVIAYTLQGLLECALINNETCEKYDLLNKVIIGADNLIKSSKKSHINNIYGMIPSEFDKKWLTNSTSSCLTGNAQFAILLYRLYQKTMDKKYVSYADSIVEAIKMTQILNSPFVEINGAVAGSYPFGMGYVRNGFPNWAAKFFSDALIYKMMKNSNVFIKA